MNYNYSDKKITAIISDSLPPGLAMNALGHMAFSAGRYSEQSLMGREILTDGDGNSHVGISKYPFIVLKASETEIKETVKKARSQGIFVVDYTKEMFDTGHDDELFNAMSASKEPKIIYHAVLIVGDSQKVKNLTSSFKLYR